MDDKWLRRKDRRKAVLSVFELCVLLAAFAWAAYTIYSYQINKDIPSPVVVEENATISSYRITGGNDSAGHASGTHFIAISYNGIISNESGRSVTLDAFKEQMKALKASGYQTIGQADILRAFNNGENLPKKALVLIFEDGVFDSAALAQPILEECNYLATICTYAGKLSDTEGRSVTSENAHDLLDTTYWEIGSNGYRISYINVFDRYKNYLGHMTADEYRKISRYIRHDYNHYLMDFLRDEYRIRQESVEEMERRITWDYEKMDEIYREKLGYVPFLYILMHSNTGAYGTDPLVSNLNEEMMKKYFRMNFNRQGTCLNMKDTSLFDLSRLQVHPHFTTNHLLMRIWDDTGDQVQFRVGEADAAKDWKRLEGVAEYSDNKIMITSLPYGRGAVMLLKELPTEFELNARLMGNVVGQQSVRLYADDNGEGGIIIRLHNDVLTIENPEENSTLFRLDLFEFDGGPYESLAENELAGKKAWFQTIIDSDESDIRVAEATKMLDYLKNRKVPEFKNGADLYVPELNMDEQADRKLRVQLSERKISLWLDDVLVADHIMIPDGDGRRLVLGAEVTSGTDRFSRTSISDDVYDAIFDNLRIIDSSGIEVYSYSEPIKKMFQSFTIR